MSNSDVMDVIGATVVPALLILVGLGLAWAEVRAFMHPPEDAPPRSVVRLLRRGAGAGCIATLGVLIYDWLHFVRPSLHPGVHPPVDLLATLSTLVLAILVLAVWDALDGLRGLRRMVDQMHKEDVRALQEMLRTSQPPDRSR